MFLFIFYIEYSFLIKILQQIWRNKNIPPLKIKTYYWKQCELKICIANSGYIHRRDTCIHYSLSYSNETLFSIFMLCPIFIWYWYTLYQHRYIYFKFFVVYKFDVIHKIDFFIAWLIGDCFTRYSHSISTVNWW